MLRKGVSIFCAQEGYLGMIDYNLSSQVQHNLEFPVFLPRSSECWHSKHIPLHSATVKRALLNVCNVYGYFCLHVCPCTTCMPSAYRN